MPPEDIDVRSMIRRLGTKEVERPSPTQRLHDRNHESKAQQSNLGRQFVQRTPHALLICRGAKSNRRPERDPKPLLSREVGVFSINRSDGGGVATVVKPFAHDGLLLR